MFDQSARSPEKIYAEAASCNGFQKAPKHSGT
jgi:hypothetical protein